MSKPYRLYKYILANPSKKYRGDNWTEENIRDWCDPSNFHYLDDPLVYASNDVTEFYCQLILLLKPIRESKLFKVLSDD